MKKCPFDFLRKKPEAVESKEPIPLLEVFRLHPSGISIEKANNKLNGSANENAIKYCGPYIHANQAGWWINPGFDADITYLGNGEWREEYHSDYEPLHEMLIESNISKTDKFKNKGRTLIGKVWNIPDLFQIWTGCIFKTPPGWSLHIRSPINFTEVHKRPFWIQEAMIESDWLFYDIWMNLEFHQPNTTVKIRRDMWPPLAQIVPVKRESYHSNWTAKDEVMDSSNPSHKEVWDFWQEYNYQKWISEGEKDPTTYHRTRKIALRYLYPEDGSH